MEDAHIASIPFGDKKCGLFAVFDGHGGTKKLIKVLSVLFSWRDISAKNSEIIKVSRKAGIK